MAIYDIAGGLKDYQPVQAFQQARSQRIRDDVNRNMATRQQQQIAQHEQEAPLRDAQQKRLMQQEKMGQVTDQIAAMEEIYPKINSQAELDAWLPKMEEINPAITKDIPKDYTSARAKLRQMDANGKQTAEAWSRVTDAQAAADESKLSSPNSPETKRLSGLAELEEQMFGLGMQKMQLENQKAAADIGNKYADTDNKERQARGESTTTLAGLQATRRYLIANGGSVKEIAEVDAQIAKNATVTGTTPDDPRSSSTISKAHQKNLDIYNSSDSLDEILTDAMPKMMSLQGSVGARGRAAMSIGGILTNMNQDEAAEFMTDFIAGADQETIAGMQTQMKVIRAQLTPILTLEKGTRISDKELEISNTTAGVIDEIESVADLAKAYPQVIGALKQLYEESLVSRYQLAKQDKNINYMYDLTTQDGVTSIIRHMEQAGIDEKGRARAITRLMRIQRSGK